MQRHDGVGSSRAAMAEDVKAPHGSEISESEMPTASMMRVFRHDQL